MEAEDLMNYEMLRSRQIQCNLLDPLVGGHLTSKRFTYITYCNHPKKFTKKFQETTHLKKGTVLMSVAPPKSPRGDVEQLEKQQSLRSGKVKVGKIGCSLDSPKNHVDWSKERFSQ